MQQRPEHEQLESEQSEYIRRWISQQPDDRLRQRFADGLLSQLDAGNLIAAAVLDDLLGPACEYHVCDDCSRRHSLADLQYDCEKWETHHLPADICPAWNALEANLPEGTEWKFYELFACLLKRLEKPNDGVGKWIYVAKLTVPVGPFRFERTILLGQAQ